MKRFLKYISLFALGFLAIILTAYICRPKHSENYLAAINHKLKLLDSVPSPRIVILGGSNVCFGIDSKTLSDSLGIPVINLALHAGTGLKYYLDIAAQKSRDNDIVVVMPEIQQFYGQFNGQASVISPIFFLTDSKYQKDILKELNASQAINILEGSPKAIYDIYRSATVIDTIYNIKGFNGYGDHVSHWNAKPTKFNELSPISNPIDQDAIDYLKSTVETLRSQGKFVLLFPPTVTKSYFESEQNTFKELYDFSSKENIAFSIDGDAFVVPDDCCFDAMYHRNKKGVDIVTQKIINELKSTPEVMNVITNHLE